MKLERSLKQELEIALESALMLAELGTSVEKLAERIYDSERVLIEKVQRMWVVTRLIGMLKRKQRMIPAKNQLTLPGFARFPQIIRLRNGSRPPFINATLSQLCEFRDVLLKRRPPHLKTVEKFIELMAGYEQRRPGITVAEVILAEKTKSDEPFS